ncbi:MAG: glycosyltransferase [Burkholderiales bacterium]
MASPTRRVFFLLRDGLPTYRPDVAILFGQELPKKGIQADLLGQQGREGLASAECDWPAGRMKIEGRDSGSLLGELFRPMWDLASFRHLRGFHDLIQVRDKIRAALIALAFARVTGKPFTFWMSFPMALGFQVRADQVAASAGAFRAVPHRLRARWASRVFFAWVAPFADHIFVQSQAMLEMMAARGIPRSRMSAVPMGVQATALAAVRPFETQPAVLQGRRVVAYLGTLGSARDPNFMLDALRHLRQQEPKALLLLVGDAPSADERLGLRDAIAASGLAEHVHLTGWLPQPEALRWLACAEVGWSPVPRGPLFDVSSPTKAVEYLGLGLPCVGNDIPDQELVLRESGGGLCVPMQPEAFAEATMRLLADPAAARAMGQRGQDWVAKHRDYAVLAAGVAAVYQRLLSRP